MDDEREYPYDSGHHYIFAGSVSHPAAMFWWLSRFFLTTIFAGRCLTGRFMAEVLDHQELANQTFHGK